MRIWHEVPEQLLQHVHTHIHVATNNIDLQCLILKYEHVRKTHTWKITHLEEKALALQL